MVVSNNIFNSIFGGQVRGAQKAKVEPEINEDIIEAEVINVEPRKPFIQAQASQNNPDGNSEGFFSSRSSTNNNFDFSEKVAFSQDLSNNVAQAFSERTFSAGYTKHGGSFSSFSNREASSLGRQFAYAA